VEWLPGCKLNERPKVWTRQRHWLSQLPWGPVSSYNDVQANPGFSLRRCFDETVDHQRFDRTIWIGPGQHRPSGMTNQVSDEQSTAMRAMRQ
jgi:hypothetical protein